MQSDLYSGEWSWASGQVPGRLSKEFGQPFGQRFNASTGRGFRCAAFSRTFRPIHLTLWLGRCSLWLTALTIALTGLVPGLLAADALTFRGLRMNNVTDYLIAADAADTRAGFDRDFFGLEIAYGISNSSPVNITGQVVLTTSLEDEAGGFVPFFELPSAAVLQTPLVTTLTHTLGGARTVGFTNKLQIRPAGSIRCRTTCSG